MPVQSRLGDVRQFAGEVAGRQVPAAEERLQDAQAHGVQYEIGRAHGQQLTLSFSIMRLIEEANHHG